MIYGSSRELNVTIYFWVSTFHNPHSVIHCSHFRGVKARGGCKLNGRFRKTFGGDEEENEIKLKHENKNKYEKKK